MALGQRALMAAVERAVRVAGIYRRRSESEQQIIRETAAAAYRLGYEAGHAQGTAGYRDPLTVPQSILAQTLDHVSNHPRDYPGLNGESGGEETGT